MIAKQDELLEEINKRSLDIENWVENYLNAQQIGTVNVRNIFSLPLDLPATLALYRLMERRQDLLFVLHHHDFVWEWKGREKQFTCHYPLINELIHTMFPPKKEAPNRQHTVLSSIAQAELKRNTGIEHASVVPDSFDFDTPIPSEEYIKAMKKDL